MTAEDRRKWDSRYADDDRWGAEREPFPWLVEHTPPTRAGLALDLACGLGHDAVWLAARGYRVLAVDGSIMGLRRGLAAARRERLADRILFAQVDLDSFRPSHCRFDLICMIRFLNRDLLPWLAAALRPGGALIVATLNWEWAEMRPDVNPDFLLQPGELASLFPALTTTASLEQDGLSCLAAIKPR